MVTVDAPDPRSIRACDSAADLAWPAAVVAAAIPRIRLSRREHHRFTPFVIH
jgi:hypothetical protein